MYIISKFKDYYDIHPNEKGDLPKFVRQTDEREIGDRWKQERATKTKEERQRVVDFHRHVDHLAGRLHRLPDRTSAYSVRNQHDFNSPIKETGLIAFCGRAYPFYIVGDYYISGGNNRVCYDVEQIIKAVEELVDKDRYGKYKDALKALCSDAVQPWRRYGGMQLTRGTWTRYQQERVSQEFGYLRTVNVDTHRYFGSPIMVLLGRNVIVNANLSKFNFACQVAPYQAYQELEMFIGNTFTEPDPADLVMDEKLKVHTKGMDQWSFRTMPGDSSKAKKKRLKDQIKKIG